MPSDIIIFEDNENLAKLMAEALGLGGYSVTIKLDGRDALSAIKASGARLVILDIMMPGMDGVTVLRLLRANPETRALKVVVASGKKYEEDKARAYKAGVNLFLEKPLNLKGLVEQISSVLGAPQPTAKTEQKLILAGQMKITILGSWSLHPSGLLDYQKKSCCAVLRSGEALFLFDAGSGLFDLSETSLEGVKKVFLFVVHAGPPCTSGMAGIRELLNPAHELQIYAPEGLEGLLPIRPYLPEGMRVFPVFEEDYSLFNGAALSAMHAQYVGSTMTYKLKVKDRQIVYAPLGELSGEHVGEYRDKMKKFCQGADVLIHDAYNRSAGGPVRSNGHSSWTEAVEVALLAKVKKLILFGHDPTRSEWQLQEQETQALQMIKEGGNSLQLVTAKDGLQLDL
ncbi:MAG: response regulator [Elusimicrobia bacterium]|nr:response regulator [Elusimicrobiota bacterium]